MHKFPSESVWNKLGDDDESIPDFVPKKVVKINCSLIAWPLTCFATYYTRRCFGDTRNIQPCIVRVTGGTALS